MNNQRKAFPKVIQACVDNKTYESLAELSAEMQIGLSAMIRLGILERLKQNTKNMEV